MSFHKQTSMENVKVKERQLQCSENPTALTLSYVMSNVCGSATRNCGKALSPFPFLKDGPEYPLLKEIRKETSEHISLALTNSYRSWQLDTSGLLHSVGKFSKQKRLLE